MGQSTFPERDPVACLPKQLARDKRLVQGYDLRLGEAGIASNVSGRAPEVEHLHDALDPLAGLG